VSPHARALVAIVAMTIFAAGLSASEPLVLKALFDGLGARQTLRTLAALAGLLSAVLLTKEVVGLHLDRSIWRVRIAVHEALTRSTVERLHDLSLSYHKRESVGGTMAKMDRGINGAVSAFSDVAFQMLPTLVYLAMSLAVMVRLDVRVTLLACAFVPLPPAVSAWAAREQTERERSLMKRWTGLFARLNEVLSGIAVVKSFAMEDIEKRRFLAGIREANEIVVRGVESDSRVAAARNTAVVLARLSALALGGLYVARGELSLGALVAFLGYLGALFGPVQGLAGMVQTLRRGVVGLETVFSILDAREDCADARGAVALHGVRGNVEFRHVSFGYRPGRPVLQGIDFAVEAGQTVALVGPSGSGKTTLMALLQRLYDPDAGQIRIDGVDIARITQRSLREVIGIVLQDDVLFSDSVRDNIAFGRPGAPLWAIERAARDAHAHDFIAALPEGYDTRVGDRGAVLSTGQRQRIAIARALLKNPRILILDEATSALDAESEALVQDAMTRLEQGRTTFIIAHRLATVTGADRILVFGHGRIVESGTHEELVTFGGRYASLVRRQTRGLLEVDAA
jgi:ATP-binding cassette subfamily B protein